MYVGIKIVTASPTVIMDARGRERPGCCACVRHHCRSPAGSPSPGVEDWRGGTDVIGVADVGRLEVGAKGRAATLSALLVAASALAAASVAAAAAVGQREIKVALMALIEGDNGGGGPGGWKLLGCRGTDIW